MGSTVIRILLEREEAVRGLLLSSEQATVPGQNTYEAMYWNRRAFAPCFSAGRMKNRW